MHHCRSHARHAYARRAYNCVAVVVRQFTMVVVLATLPTVAFGQASPYRLPSDGTLDSLIAEALAARAELGASEADIRAEEAQVPQAGAFPDPTLQLGIQNDGFSSIQIGTMETSFLSIMASQTFPWPGKRQLRSDIASLEVKSAERANDKLRLAIEASVRQLYVSLLLVRDQLLLLEKLTALWGKSAETARTVYEAGSGAQSDILRAQLELSRMKQRKIALAAQETTIVQNLNRLRGRPLADAIATTATLSSLGLPPLYDKKDALADATRKSPDIAATQIEYDRAQKAKALAKKGSLPDVTISAGVMPRGDLPLMWLLTVSAPIPIFAGRKQAQAVKESQARAEAAQATQLAIEQQLALRIAERHTALQALLASIDLYDKGLLVQSRATAESTLSQYRVGKASFASVLDANAGVLADEAAYLAMVAEAHRLLIAANEVSLAPMAVSSGVGPGAAMPTSGVASGAATVRPGEQSGGTQAPPMTGGM